MADQQPGEQPPDVSPEPGRPPLTEGPRVPPRPATSRLVSPSAHRWPGGIDDDASSAPPDDAIESLELASEAPVETEPAPDVPARDALGPDPAAGAEPAPPIEVEPATGAPGPARSRLVRAWSAVPRPLRIALALLLLPPTGYVIAVRSGWNVGVKLGAVAAWTALLLVPVLLTRGPGAPLRLPVSSASPPALAIQEEVAATTPSSRGSVIVSTVGTARPGPTVRPGSTPAPGSTPSPETTLAPGTTPAPETPPSVAPTAVPTLPGPPPTPATTPVATPVDTCGAPENPWGYNLCGGNPVTSPPPAFCSVFDCVPHFSDHRRGGYVAECSDGTYAYAGDPQGSDAQGPESCTPHGGEMHQLYGP